MKHNLLRALAGMTLLTATYSFAGDLTAPGLTEPVLASRQAKEQRSYQAWKLSLIPLAASQAMDISSSYGMRELNPTLADPNGRFGARSAMLKLGITAGILGAEYLIVRKHQGAAKVLWKMNLASAGVTAGVAAHNYALH